MCKSGAKIILKIFLNYLYAVKSHFLDDMMLGHLIFCHIHDYKGCFRALFYESFTALQRVFLVIAPYVKGFSFIIIRLKSGGGPVLGQVFSLGNLLGRKFCRYKYKFCRRNIIFLSV